MSADTWINLVFVLIFCGAAWALWRHAQPRPLFTVRVVDGKPQAKVGTVTPAFMERIREVAVANEIIQGKVSGFPQGTLVQLRFSPQFTESARQQLRNWWAVHGWSAPPADLSRRRI